MRSTLEHTTPRAQAKREQILAAARELFLERGFSGTSTNAIASTAGVSKETLYRYFSNKEALLSECLRGLILDLLREDLLMARGSRPIDSRDELRAALLQLADGLVETATRPDYLGLVRVIFNETPRLPQLGEIFRSAVPANTVRRVADLLKRAQEGKVAHVADTEAAARMFAGPFLTYLMDGLLAGEAPPQRPTTERVEAIVDLYLQAVTKP